MDDPVTELEPEIEKWTKEEVCQWLTTRVKVSPTVTHRFFEGEVLGEYIKYFDKGDILDLTKEHGTAVKVTAHLELLKQGRTFQSPFPEYVERWSREQVYQWITEHAQIDGKHADQLLEGRVSGDCLVCFQKQDFLDLKVPTGPAVKILALLRGLKNNPEPVLNAAVNTSTSQEEAATSSQPRSRKKPHKKGKKASEAAIPTLQKTETPRREAPRTEAPRREAPRTEAPRTVTPWTETPRTEAPRREAPRTESTRTEAPRRETAWKEAPRREAPRTETPRTEAPWTPTTAPLHARDPGPPDPVQLHPALPLLLGILEDLGKGDLKKFRFHLRELRMCSNDAIPQSRLEDKDRTDLADVMLQHYGPDTALQAMLRVLPMIPRQDLKEGLKKKMGRLKQQCGPKDGLRREANQGEKLNNLLTCGGNSLGFYNEYVVVVNKSAPQQLEYLEFLKTLKLFCVLDFDPNSAAIDGLCHSYGESRVANKHDPALFVGETGDVIKKLNLYKQTSWVFCNGREDLDSESCKVLDYKTWLRTACRDVEQLVSFVCKPEVLLQGRTLIIFLLLSPVLTEKDPIFDTYNAFYKNTEGENIISICESPSTFEKWRLMVEGKCDSDISQQAVWELSLSEINGTVKALGPLDQSSDRLLPSSDSSFVVLTQKQKDLMTALDILCLNQCEKMYDEHSTVFRDFKIRVEAEFFRGGKVKWWNFYLCEKPKAKPFIKRDKYEKLKQMIKSQSDQSVDVCTLLNLFHHPGCGGTTLAMHVMWGLRQHFRCAVLKDNTLPHPEIAIQVRELMMLKNEKPSPVLLLVDDSKDTVNAQNLVTCIKIAIEESCLSRTIDAPSCHIIILNCVRSQSPQDLYRQRSKPSLFITSSITPKEQVEFEEKLLELRDTHTKPENFYSFMIMKSNFDPKYVEGLVHNTLENFDLSTKKAQLFAFLSLLKTYVFDSEISISLSEEYLGLKMFKWNEDNVLEGMKPYSNFLIIDQEEEWGGYKFLRILHHSIASACIEELERTYLVKASDIIMSILHCDLFFTTTPKIGKGNLERSIQRMLIQRQSRKDGDERDTFSPLIEKIHKQQGKGMIQDIFTKASSRLVESASIPQALARYFYLNERDFTEALNWAEKAKKIRENSYTVNMIGQVYKNQLKSNIPSKKNGPPCSPEDLDANINLSKKAVTAFKRAEQLSNTDELNEAPWDDDESEDNAAKSSYNFFSYVGVLKVAFLVFEITILTVL
ncbi:sterile alpha motif domain-containing protein 9-like [Gadus chalcogrammus]|uniref:sterile alpha motif domain-containing protein 9-like n=1 Tax=Gadus chalcogrammus TaxID=1042646 RepID=UPI0024C481E1|nr:sterile alpha motif domain-containing protein 9-like [Gadus chalcogrammus]